MVMCTGAFGSTMLDKFVLVFHYRWRSRTLSVNVRRRKEHSWFSNANGARFYRLVESCQNCSNKNLPVK